MKFYLQLLLENKFIIVIVAVVLALFLGFSVVKCSMTQAELSNEEEEAQEETFVDINTNFEVEEEEADTLLSEELKAKRAEYDDDIKALIEFLATNAWISSGEDMSLVFSDKSITNITTSGEEHETQAYVIVGYNVEDATGEDYTERITAIIQTANGVYTLTRDSWETVNSDTNSTTSYTLTSSMFSGETFTRVIPVSDLQISSLTQDFVALLGGSTQELTDSLNAYCGEHFPSATTADWSQLVTIDYACKTLTTNFTLDNTTRTTLSVVYNFETKAYDVGEE